ncbi:HAD hydrolase family protein [Actinokineospora sp. HUAS TT18]|uniref:HAD hydrolase family protein n=1 Tax=Actinokineospora sp. HUAS TT18 TaxID=3447451 RepID=UPI003F51F4EA
MPGRLLLVASDLDKTLLDGDGWVTARAVRAIDRLRVSGGRFLAVTARPLRDAVAVAQAAGADRLICSGGAVVADPTGRVLDSTLFTTEATRALTVLARALAADVRVGYDYLDRCELDDPFVLGSTAIGVVRAERAALPVEPAVKLLVQADSVPVDLLAARLRAAVGPHALVAVSGSHFVEILPAGIDKACRLPAVRDLLTVAFGDMPVDLPMLRWARLAVAVSNAHPDVLAEAAFVTGSHLRDGVATFLEALLRGDHQEER